MFAKAVGETTHGIDGVAVRVEVDVTNGLPGFDLVGLPALSVRESKERVRSALKNSGFSFPMSRITVNLAPADLKKDGSSLDLPIALGILTSTRVLEQEMLQGKVFVGELSLDGNIQRVSGVLSMIIDAKRCGYQEIFIPTGNAAEGKLIKGIKVYTPENINQIVEHLQRKKFLDELRKENILQNTRCYKEDFADVKGQLVARRALEIAAAGGHSVIMVGSPGCGKTMLARRMATILPPLTEAEALEVTKIYSVAGLLPQGESLMLERPFRSPHHGISASALLGGGSVPRPGEVTLSHHGVLFLDELPEFERNTLEMLRQPLEDGEVNISRVRAALTYPSKFYLVAAQNPCPCGYLGDRKHKCTCRSKDIDNYRRKISGPLMDRIDIQINLARVEFEDLKAAAPVETSAVIRERVVRARSIQLARLETLGIFCNAGMGRREVERYCRLGEKEQALLEKYFAVLNLSVRSHDRILKVARTIADLDGSEDIAVEHLAEAIQLRTSVNG